MMHRAGLFGFSNGEEPTFDRRPRLSCGMRGIGRIDNSRPLQYYGEFGSDNVPAVAGSDGGASIPPGLSSSTTSTPNAATTPAPVDPRRRNSY